PLSVLVSKLQPTNGSTPLAMLWVASADVPLVPEGGLRELFGLTAAEARLAQRLVRGLTLEESAQDLGTTTNTAKT
ncbi:helix-turn-helix transcriptional regulator, partial [Klebsiella variicola]|uniref:helix-turn-helix transcriptional regulator n=3 Tax=Pseudomonadota TaxID=1224 RepID=UPI002360682B